MVDRTVLQLVVGHQDICMRLLRQLGEPLERHYLSGLRIPCSRKAETAEEARCVLGPVLVIGDWEEEGGRAGRVAGCDVEGELELAELDLLTLLDDH